MRISQATRLFGVGLCLGLFVMAGVSWFQVQKIRIGGAPYQHIVNGKDLIADLLPPPLYVIDAYLAAHTAPDRPGELAQTRQTVARLHQDYDARMAHWRGADIDPEIKAQLLGDVDREAKLFWTTVENEELPAVAAGDIAGAEAALARAGEAFRAHKAAVEALNPLVAASNAQGEQEARAATSQSVAILAGLLVLLTAMILGALLALKLRVTDAISTLTVYMRGLAGGDYDTAPPVARRKDEVGDMVAALAVFREGALERRTLREQQEAARMEAEALRHGQDSERRAAETERTAVMERLAGALSRLAAGDLTAHIVTAFPADYEPLRKDFNTALSSLSEILGSINATTGGVRSAAGEITQAADDLSRRTEQQAASLEEAAAALDQLTATIRTTAGGAQEARQFVAGARSDAERSGAVVGEAISAMARIEESSNQIARIIGVINEISFQTNLLALNAGVEAARAGEAGRGFAVVASEVRALAQRSAEAATEIRELISLSSQHVSAGVSMVNETGQALESIVSHVGHIDELVRGIALSAQEQATGAAEVNVAVNQMDHMTQQNAAMVEQTTAAAHGMSASAVELAQLLARFKLAARTERLAA